jgi:poly-gamma-glutamate capsule biosynthesis protein CapA/YwtB (metallophosphatase superfamily)
MRTERGLAGLFVAAVFLAGCTAANGNFSTSPTSPEASATRTPTLPIDGRPAFTSTIPSSSPTEMGNMPSTQTTMPSLHVNLQAVGDMMLARSVGEQVLSKGPEIVFAGVQDVLASADVLVGNLECALTTSGSPQPKSFAFAAPPQAGQSLVLSGVTVLSLANNHAMDFGVEGLFETRKTLEQLGIASVGAGANAVEAHSPVFLERNGLQLAFLAYVDVPAENGGFDTQAWIATNTQPGVAWADLTQITADVTAAKAKADVVIVLLHSGYEVDTYIPSIAPNQREEAQAAIDAGAALVIGSHSHILQPIEWYHGGLIAYSLGNFVFDNYRGIANASIILRVVLTSTGVESYDWAPVLIENGLPRLATRGEVPAIATMVAP